MTINRINRLTFAGIQNLKKHGYYLDGAGLYFRVSRVDSRLWTFRFTRDGKSRDMGLGPYPEVSLKEARERAASARALLRDGIDPIDHRRAARGAMLAERAAAQTFRQCADAFIDAKEPEWKSIKHSKQFRATLAAHAYPVIGALPVASVTQAHILLILEPIWQSRTTTAARLRGRLEGVLDYATARGFRTGENPARWKGHLDKLLATPGKINPVQHFTALPYPQIGAFLADLRRQAGTGARALEFTILTACRSGEARGATWDEIDLATATWTIPARRMKSGKEHVIPLSEPVLALLHSLPRQDDLLFPGSKGGPLSDMSLTAVLRRMGRQITAHGFRSTFRDWAGEVTAYPREVIEHALSHLLKSRAEAAYQRGTLFVKRRRLMADWAAACDTPARGAGAVPIRGAHD